MKGSERAELRAEAHHLKPGLHVGHAGITDSVVKSLDDMLRTHELVKCQVAKGGELVARDAAALLAPRVSAEVVQVIGRTFTMYRHNPELHQKAGQLPPWRR
jgi:RNA-binding protein